MENTLNQCLFLLGLDLTLNKTATQATKLGMQQMHKKDMKNIFQSIKTVDFLTII